MKCYKFQLIYNCKGSLLNILFKHQMLLPRPKRHTSIALLQNIEKTESIGVTILVNSVYLNFNYTNKLMLGNVFKRL